MDRYFHCIENINIINDNNGLDYFIKTGVNIDFDINQKFISWSIGASYYQKALSATQIIEVCNNLSERIVLLGGVNEQDIGNQIVKESSHNKIYNFCGQLSLDESAYLIKKSYLVLSNDTGLMHIAASFKKPIISFWGCTKPSLGFYPYMNNHQCIQIVANPLMSPCSKHGRSCKFQKEGCIKKIDSNVIFKSISEFISS